MGARVQRLFDLITRGDIDGLAKGLNQPGVHINVKNKYGETLLHQAVEDSNQEAVRLLIARGISLDERDQSGNTALYCAVSQSNYAIAELLLKGGSDVNGKNAEGMTALRLSVTTEVRDVRITPLLLSYGADPGIANDAGVSSIEYARRTGNKPLLKQLTAAVS